MRYIYLEDMFPLDKRDTCLRIVTRIVFLIRWVTIAPCGPQSSVGFSLYDLVKEGIFDVMPRTKRSPSTTTTNQISGQPAKDTKRNIWINVVLDEYDIDILERDNTSAEIVGGMLLSVAMDGYGFSVKRMSDGQSYMCAIIGRSSVDPARECGVSAFSGNPRDAILCCLYKFKEKLGGAFSGDADDTVSGRPRFR
jgi:hypothetical protein